VTLNGTHGNLGFGGRAAAPVFHAVATEALRVLDVPKDLPEAPPPPVVAGNAADKDDLAIADLGRANRISWKKATRDAGGEGHRSGRAEGSRLQRQDHARRAGGSG